MRRRRNHLNDAMRRRRLGYSTTLFSDIMTRPHVSDININGVDPPQRVLREPKAVRDARGEAHMERNLRIKAETDGMRYAVKCEVPQYINRDPTKLVYEYLGLEWQGLL